MDLHNHLILNIEQPRAFKVAGCLCILVKVPILGRGLELCRRCISAVRRMYNYSDIKMKYTLAEL